MENKIELKATLETLTKKDGGTYDCVILKLTDNVDKKVFLEPAELELIKINNSNKTVTKSKMPF